MSSHQSISRTLGAWLSFATSGFLSALLGACSAAGDVSPEDTVTSEDAIGAVPIETIDRSDAVLGAAASVTSFSGNGPADRAIFLPYTNNEALYGIGWSESSDDPCYFDAKFRNVAGGTEATTLTMNLCAGHSRGDYRSVSLPADYFVTGVRVCLNSGGDKVKGVQLIGKHILCLLGADGLNVTSSGTDYYSGNGVEYALHSDPTTTYRDCSDLTESRYYERTNCAGSNNGPDNDWEVVRSCGSNQVATGFKFGITGGSGDRQMAEGIALECRAVTP